MSTVNSNSRTYPRRISDTFRASEDGLVPASTDTDGTKVLYNDGLWRIPGGGGSLADGDKGDLTVTGSGSIWTIDAGVVSNAKLATVATATFKGRTTAGTGAPEDLTVAQAKALLDLTGINSGDQTITLTGDVTGTGTSSFAATIAADAVTFAKMQNISTARLLGRSTAGAGDVEQLTVTSPLSITGGAVVFGTNDLDNNARVGVRKNSGGSTSQRRRLNLIQGTGVTLTVADDPVDEEIDITIDASGTGVVSDGDYGDIVVSSSGTVWTIDSAYTATVLSSSATSVQDGHFGDVYLKDDTSPSHYLKITDAENLTGARTLSLSVNDGDRALTLQADLTVSGTASISGTHTGTHSGTSSGTNTGDQTITLTTDVTGTGTGSFAATIAADAVTNAKLANMATATFKGRTTAGTGDPEDLTVAQAKTLLALASTDISDFTEASQDAVGAMVDSSLTYVDATPLLQRAALTGDVTASAGSNATTIAADAVTNAKLANVATQTIKGRTTAGTGDPEDLTVTSPITLVAGSGTVGFDQTVALGNNARVAVAKAGSTTGTRRRINFIEGSGMSITLADDSGGEKVDITLASSGVTSTSHQQIMARISIGI